MKLRVARHTKDIDSIIDFYINILGIDFLGEFKNHEGYDGVFIGIKNKDWHLEFTASNEKPIHNSDEDDLLVFYCTLDQYLTLQKKFQERNINPVKAKNPYWNNNGLVYLDPDGFRVVISVSKFED